MPSLSTVRQAFARHQQRQHCLQVCHELVQLTVHLQQHRGITLAILGGDVFFEDRLGHIKRNVINALQNLQKIRQDLIPEEQWQALCSEWFTVNHHWRQDSALQNFEIHTHLIQQLLRLFKGFQQGALFVSLDRSHQEMARLTLGELPELLETAAQIRGIGTHRLVSQAVETEFADRLRFLSRYFTRATEHISQCHDLETTLQAHSQWQEILQAWERVAGVVRSMDAVEEQAMPADQFFSETSHIVFYIQQCMKLGLKRLNNATDPAIQAWIDAGSGLEADAAGSPEPAPSPPLRQGGQVRASGA